MKTKLISLIWRGSASVDPRFSAAMLPWSIADIYTRDSFERLSIGIENGIIETYNADFELQFTHNLKYIVGMCKVIARRTCTNGRTKYADFTIVPSNKIAIKSSSNGTTANGTDDDRLIMNIIGPEHGIIYLLKDPRDPLLHIYLYESESLDDMTELMHQMRDPSQTHGGSVGSIPSTFVGKSGANDQSTLQKALRGSHDIHSTPASNLKLSEAVRNAHHDGSPSLMSTSKSYTNGLSHSAGTIHMQVPGNSCTNERGAGTINQTSQQHIGLIDISANNSQFFEVMYVGKIKVSHKRVPFTFIDDALPKFKAYDAQKIKMQADAARRHSTASIESVDSTSRKNSTNSSSNSDEDSATKSTISQQLKIVEEQDDDNNNNNSHNDKSETDETDETFKEKILNTKLSEENKENSLPHPRRLMRGLSQVTLPIKFDQTTSLPLPPPPPIIVENADVIPKQRDRSASIGSIPIVEQNRTMVFLVGKSDLRLISPDRKQVLLYKDFKDVASCAQGHKNADHFGIICREPNNEGYIGYVFKCQSDSVADDIVTAISQAFVSCTEQHQQKQKDSNQIFSCDHCPMLWYHKLCSDIEGLSEKKTQTTIFRRIEMLSDDEQTVVMAKYYGAEEMADHSIGEQNQFLMMLLRAHCESRQQRHVHDTAENRSEFLNQYLGGSTIFMKAKRSLSNSFDHLLKRRNSKDDFGAAAAAIVSGKQETMSAFGGKDTNQSKEHLRIDLDKSGNMRPRAASIGSAPMTNANAEQLKSPMMDIFMKVGNSPKESSTNQAGSWRQEILNRVVTPSKKHTNRNGEDVEFMSPRHGNHHHHRRRSSKLPPQEKRTAAELRQLWRTAIRQTILLARMEKENARLQACHNEHELKKIKLDYDEIMPCDKQAIERWESFIDKELIRISNKRDPKVLLQAIRTGVPRTKRGDIWHYLAEQHSMNTAPIDAKKFPNFNTPYKVLLKSLTEHQHAIFIDLGRTFPNHKYYKAALGVGQLSLFNILKAYSILDPELGYCQGLGFICGVLLLHCEEEEAFQLLKHLMFQRHMRTKYLPDMKEFQLQLYQLSRLVRDHIPDLYDWLDHNDVSPTLYAAPWILTVFSSQFPLGFVTRVFDVLFLESPEVIFKVAVAMLNLHKDELLKRDNFEEIMDYLKTILPQITGPTLDKILKEVFTMDIRKQLSEYQVEYNVLQEEITTSNHHLESLKKEKETNRHLENQLQFAQSSITQLEKTRSSQQHQIQSLQSQVQSLETTVQALGHYLSQLTDRNHNIEMPGDIRRMVQYICNADNTQSSHRKKPIFVERKIGKSMSVNAQLGFPLKVLEELNESAERDSPTPTSKSSSGSVTPTGTSSLSLAASTTSGSIATKTPFFESTYHQLRQQNRLRPNRFDDVPSPTNCCITPNIDIKLPDHVEKALENLTISPKESDSGIATPLSPRTCGIVHETIEQSSPSILYSGDMHPLSSCEDVNFKFNGTTQLKSFRPQHFHSGGAAGGGVISRSSSIANSTTTNSITTNESDGNNHAHSDGKLMGRS